jgi:hypothetical protein
MGKYTVSFGCWSKDQQRHQNNRQSIIEFKPVAALQLRSPPAVEANGQWSMVNGQWSMANGQWAIMGI